MSKTYYVTESNMYESVEARLLAEPAAPTDSLDVVEFDHGQERTFASIAYKSVAEQVLHERFLRDLPVEEQYSLDMPAWVEQIGWDAKGISLVKHEIARISSM